MDSAGSVAIPKRALFKAAEVCELVKVQPYVLRSWEAEFPELGVARTAGGPRVYRRAAAERVLQLKHLLLGQALTPAGGRPAHHQDGPPGSARAPGHERVSG